MAATEPATKAQHAAPAAPQAPAARPCRVLESAVGTSAAPSSGRLPARCHPTRYQAGKQGAGHAGQEGRPEQRQPGGTEDAADGGRCRGEEDHRAPSLQEQRRAGDQGGLARGRVPRRQAQGRNANAAQDGAEEVMESSMKRSIAWLGGSGPRACRHSPDAVAATTAAAWPRPRHRRAPSRTSGSQAIAAAAAIPANDTSTNSSSAFSVLQDNGVPAVIVTSPPVVNFTVFSDGAVKQGLTLTDMSFAIAKLVPGTERQPRPVAELRFAHRDDDRCQCRRAPGREARRSGRRRCRRRPIRSRPAQANQLVYNADGYYTYTFSTDITDPASTIGVVFEPNLHAPHRDPAELHQRGRRGRSRQSVFRRHLRCQRQLGRGHRSDQDPGHGRRQLLQRLPREAGAARWRARRHAVLRDVPQPRHHRRQQRQRADDGDDGRTRSTRAGCWRARSRWATTTT